MQDHSIAEPTDQYLSNFSWNKIRYRADKPLSELIDTLQKVGRLSTASKDIDADADFVSFRSS